jgi:cyclopropane-fatty-acyl-phospholipid synthase
MTAWFARWILSRLLRRIAVGTLVLAEGSQRRTFGSGSPVGRARLHSGRVWPMLLRGSSGMADAYARGLWDSPDLVALIQLGARNAAMLDRLSRRFALILRPLQRARAAWLGSTRERSRQDIAAHYDLGNQLFAHMLDSTMTYSCAVFESDHTTLEQGQLAKLERICDKLGLRAGDQVLEIGTGWGAFAMYAASTRGCHVTTTTISEEQYRYVLKRVRRAGLQETVTVLKQDYRDLSGSYDKLVSIEMIEAVGWRNFGTFFSQCSRLLAANGCMLLQAITIDDRAYDVEKASRSFINTQIFPGGCLPSLEVISRQLARRTDMQAVDLEDLTPHYVQTLRLWRQRFAAAAESLGALGYDERFRRIWDLYLAYCEAGFAERRICDVQMLLAKPLWRAAPASRTSRSENSLSHVHQIQLGG